MATRKIIDAKHNGEKVWLKGHAQAIYMSDGSTVEDTINDMKAEDSGITTELDPIFSASPAAKITDDNISSWNNKVDKVDGKQLSTEDFTTALMNKLSGLNNYDDTTINQAIQSLQTQLNTLVSGNASSAVESFNEIIAFLEGIEDSQSLDSIIASIEQQIAGKMDKVTLAAVATSGDYNDLSNKPTIPTAVTESTVSGWGFTKNTGTVTGVKVNGSTKNPSSGIVDLGTVITTIDSSMSSTSTNTVQNKVIKSYIDNNCNIPTLSTTASSKSLTANKYCRWTNTPTSITITLATPSDTSIVNNYMFEFTASSSGCTLSVPSTIKWINGTAPSIEAGKTYQISIINNLATVAKFS